MTTENATSVDAARCERCDAAPLGCRHTAPPTSVGDRIHHAMPVGAWSRALDLRSNSRVRDRNGEAWVRTRHQHNAWENVADGTTWPLWQIVDERQGFGPLAVEHVAGASAAAARAAQASPALDRAAVGQS